MRSNCVYQTSEHLEGEGRSDNEFILIIAIVLHSSKLSNTCMKKMQRNTHTHTQKLIRTLAKKDRLFCFISHPPRYLISKLILHFKNQCTKKKKTSKGGGSVGDPSGVHNGRSTKREQIAGHLQKKNIAFCFYLCLLSKQAE